MNNSVTEIDNWLLASELDDGIDTYDVWESGFEADRQVVFSKLGPYTKFFLRPANFVKRFFHTVYPLPIEEWQCKEQVKLYDDFCTINIILDVRFQATFSYASNNIEILTELNDHIKAAYHDLSIDIVHKELLNLPDGSWVRNGLEKIETKISNFVSEMLIMQNIQSQVVCNLTPTFEEFPDVKFAKESVYLNVLKKSFEFKDQQKALLFEQQQQEEKTKIVHKRSELERINEIAELERQKQLVQAENKKQRLLDKIQYQQEQFEISKKLHKDAVEHNVDLKKITLSAEFKEKTNEMTFQREHEQQEKQKQIDHQAMIKEQELLADITEYEREQASWRDSKDKTHAEELDLKHRQQQLEFETDAGFKKRYESQRLAMQEESFMVRKNADVYLKREIELLELEKKRLALQLSIKEHKETSDNED